MPRPEKVAAVAEIKERIEGAHAVFLAEYSGLSVKQQQELRRGLLEQGAEFKVVKMTLARRAVSDLELAEFDELLIGPTGIAFADEDAVSAAKVLKEFASSHEVFTVKGGLLGTDFLTPERISQLAEIAPRDELLAMLAGALKAPLTTMAGLLAALPRGAATVFQQLLEKKQAGEFVGEEPNAEAAASVDEASGDAATDDGDNAAEAASSDEAEAEVEVETSEDETADDVSAVSTDTAEDASNGEASNDVTEATNDEADAADVAENGAAEAGADAENDDQADQSDDDDPAETAEEEA